MYRMKCAESSSDSDEVISSLGLYADNKKCRSGDEIAEHQMHVTAVTAMPNTRIDNNTDGWSKSDCALIAGVSAHKPSVRTKQTAETNKATNQSCHVGPSAHDSCHGKVGVCAKWRRHRWPLTIPIRAARGLGPRPGASAPRLCLMRPRPGRRQGRDKALSRACRCRGRCRTRTPAGRPRQDPRSPCPCSRGARPGQRAPAWRAWRGRDRATPARSQASAGSAGCPGTAWIWTGLALRRGGRTPRGRRHRSGTRR